MYLTVEEDRDAIPPVVHTDPECPFYGLERHWFRREGCLCPPFAKLAVEHQITNDQARKLRTLAYEAFNEQQAKLWAPFGKLYADLRGTQRILNGRGIITRRTFFKSVDAEEHMPKPPTRGYREGESIREVTQTKAQRRAR